MTTADRSASDVPHGSDESQGLLYHCATQAQWADLQRDGESRVSTRGRTLEQEGFIHCSYAGQVAGVLERYYADVDEPMLLLRVDPALVGAEVVVENGFPHVYGPLPLVAVFDTVPLTRGEQGWELPLAPE
ncbi:DUF952 domain-containing protein [Nakamurella flavida]|uniref:DUF952 domain-containing protein n=1 Tax=Nakamurella flavida TaxID=363630 RepID=A0A939C1K0_9ACTN|nr:DUF952 domain-containing protein [Nakamurella flavida]MBM9475066.1 DUF952 domain-containing protein [Nakamurella flavida]MDP9776635.1 uncharacterized protein (DUF952 family) [Nakamurella flavida]